MPENAGCSQASTTSVYSFCLPLNLGALVLETSVHQVGFGDSWVSGGVKSWNPL